ncbi:hexokinase, putative [Entamoeba dispar SAW760]|uniref:Hexokinase, putative n=1 Tax=Entamoeba dispar (strain ATCC PRA-260 / SAW760) TaxID=370354 RepID=B0EUT2_ENTDS|nr:hexokinase, putative [Entamoeba dispar SAW760]EDR21726.1 hexokinase, putative [Entamoeba dispar SAW760]|eukprot:EDR21726.1 hexokinase, putative [Entamoeba dispar SAW760]
MQEIIDQFAIDKEKMEVIVSKLLEEMENGLQDKPSTLQMLPTYAPIPTGKEVGTFMGIDVGGTNLRVLLLEIPEPGVRGELKSVECIMPKTSTTIDQFFGFIAQKIKEFVENNNLKEKEIKAGLTFSFAVEQIAIDKGIQQSWSKGWDIKESIGKDIVEIFHNQLAKVNVKNIRIVAFINDTVGTFANLAYDDASCGMGLIFGTGTNGCYIEKTSNFASSKLKSVYKEDYMIVNTEWGGLQFPELGLNRFDDMINDISVNKDQQRYEKMISGIYMGWIGYRSNRRKTRREYSRSEDREDRHRRVAEEEHYNRNIRRRADRSPSLSPLGDKLHSRWDEQPKAIDSVQISQQLNVHQERAAKRIYVGNINSSTSEKDIVDAFNEAMRRGDYVDKNDPRDIITHIEVNYERSYAFLEFRTLEEAVKALSLDGLTIKGASVKVRRPKDYNPVLPFISGLSQLMEPGTTNPRESILYMGNIPLQMTDEQIRKKLENLNPLKKFFVIRDPDLGAPQGKCYCLFEYQNPEYKEKILTFDGINLGGNKIEVCSGVDGFKHLPKASLNELFSKMFPHTTDLVIGTLLNSSVGYSTVFEKILKPSEKIEDQHVSRIIVIFNMVYPEDLIDQQRYIELIDDIRFVCQEYGEVESISIPRPTEENKKPSGLGRVFIEFKTIDGAIRCWKEIVKKRYDNRSLLVGFYSEKKYANRMFGYMEEEKEDDEEKGTQMEEIPNEQPQTITTEIKENNNQNKITIKELSNTSPQNEIKAGIHQNEINEGIHQNEINEGIHQNEIIQGEKTKEETKEDNNQTNDLKEIKMEEEINLQGQNKIKESSIQETKMEEERKKIEDQTETTKEKSLNSLTQNEIMETDNQKDVIAQEETKGGDNQNNITYDIKPENEIQNDEIKEVLNISAQNEIKEYDNKSVELGQSKIEEIKENSDTKNFLKKEEEVVPNTSTQNKVEESIIQEVKMEEEKTERKE